MSTNEFTHLFSPGKIGSLKLRNRIVVTAMGVSLSEDDGSVGDQLVAYHEEQAKGGVGMIVLGVTGVAWPVGAVLSKQTAISDDRYLPGLSKLCERVHSHGAKIAAQLHHGGPNSAYASARWGHPIWYPSAPPPFESNMAEYFLPEEMGGMWDAPPPRIKVLEKSDVDLVVEQFRQAARRAMQAGFDGIEIHGGHGYLLSSFMSANSNVRTDEYGGNFENRMRLPREVFAAIRSEVGPDFPVWIKLNAREIGLPGGITVEEGIATARAMQKAGVDAITVSAHAHMGIAKLHTESHTPQGEQLNVPFAARIREAVSIPVITSGRVEPAQADKIIAEGKADFIAMGRKVLADPYLPDKLLHGKQQDVRPCIYCYTCVSAIYLGQQVRCAVNPELSHEFERKRASAAPMHVAVVGGGPGGMEAARRLRASGHRVTLIEKSARLGGTLQFAGLAYEPNERLMTWLRYQVEQSGAEIRLNTVATPDLLQLLEPDAVIVATGARRSMPEIPGAGRDNVFSGDDLRQLLLGESSETLRRKTSHFSRLLTKAGAATGVTANLEIVRKASHAWMPLGHRVVIVGGELVGIELAEFLHERGRQVTVIEEAPRLGKGLTLVRRMRILQDLAEHGVALHADAKDVQIGENGVTFVDGAGHSQEITADTVIVARGATADTTLAEQLQAAGFRVLTVGDTNGVSYIEGAMRGAADAVAVLENSGLHADEMAPG